MNKKIILVSLGLLLVLSIFIANEKINEKKVVDNPQKFLYIEKINFDKSDGNYNDLFLVDCGNKKFYTSYPDRLNFEEYCN